MTRDKIGSPSCHSVSFVRIVKPASYNLASDPRYAEKEENAAEVELESVRTFDVDEQRFDGCGSSVFLNRSNNVVPVFFVSYEEKTKERKQKRSTEQIVRRMCNAALIVAINDGCSPPLSSFTSAGHPPTAMSWSYSSSGMVCSNLDNKRAFKGEHNYHPVAFSTAEVK